MIKTLRFLAIAEGISYLAFALTMPLKYGWGIKEPNYFVGMAHGVLFIAYCAFVVVAAKEYKWNFKTTFVLGMMSLVPFGTFWAERKYLRGDREVGSTVE